MLRGFDRAPAGDHDMALVPGVVLFDLGEGIERLHPRFQLGVLRTGAVPGVDLAIIADCGLESNRGLRAIGALPHFFLARPDQFDRPGRFHRQLDHLIDRGVLAGELAPEAAAERHGVESYVVQGKPRRVCGCLAAAQRVLHAAPDIQLAVLVMRGKRVGLHHHVVEEGRAVAGFDQLAPLASSIFASALISFSCAANMSGGVDSAMAAIAELGIERAQALDRRPVSFRHHRHCIVELHDLLDALHSHRRPRIDRFEPPIANRRGHYRGDAHLWQGKVDAIFGAAIDLGGNIDARDGLANQAEVLRLFQLGLGIKIALRRLGGQFAIAQRLAALGVGDHPLRGGSARPAGTPAAPPLPRPTPAAPRPPARGNLAGR